MAETSKKKVAKKKIAKKKVTQKKVTQKAAPRRAVVAATPPASNTPPKTAAAAKRVRKGRLKKSELEHFKFLLLSKRREILYNVSNIEGGALKKSRQDAAGDLSSMPLHMADIGSDTFEQEFALGLMDSERKLLQEIDEALMRIERGVYGVCEGTQVMIRKARLEAKPWAKYSVEYARQLENQGR